MRPFASISSVKILQLHPPILDFVATLISNSQVWLAASLNRVNKDELIQCNLSENIRYMKLLKAKKIFPFEVAIVSY